MRPLQLEHELAKGFRALYQASDKGYIDLVRNLVQAGANVEVSTDWGSLPLHCAAQGGHVDVAQILIEASANVEAAAKPKGYRSLHTASGYSYTDLVWILIQANAFIEAASKEGFKPLHLATQSGHIDAVEVFFGGER